MLLQAYDFLLMLCSEVCVCAVIEITAASTPTSHHAVPAAHELLSSHISNGVAPVLLSVGIRVPRVDCLGRAQSCDWLSILSVGPSVSG